MPNRSIVTALLLAVVVSGCADAHGQDATQQAGTLTGRVGMYGGPANPKTGRSELNGSPGQNVLVTVRSRDSSVVTARTGADGRFTISLAPGRYRVSACGLPKEITIAANGRATVRLQCDVP
jgi:hypothetical protein